MAWHDEYPHKIYASVLLLDGKIENWKIGSTPKENPFEFTGYWKRDRLNDYTCKWSEFVANTPNEHDRIFEVDGPEWFKQWPIAEDYRLCRP